MLKTENVRALPGPFSGSKDCQKLGSPTNCTKTHPQSYRGTGCNQQQLVQYSVAAKAVLAAVLGVAFSCLCTHLETKEVQIGLRPGGPSPAGGCRAWLISNWGEGLL
jgi:hypothetical protein